MERVVLENEVCRAVFSSHGAELISFQTKKNNLEYIWQGNQDYWSRHAPILFPIVGRLKDNQYTYKNQTYQMNQHGFARDCEFQVVNPTKDKAIFTLSSSEVTKINYPFSFELVVTYELNQDTLEITYDVISLETELIFGIGGHPAFNVPLVADTTFDEYYVEFTPSKSRTRLPLSGPFVDLNCATLAQTNTSIMLRRSWFKNDAVILRTVDENQFTIKSDATTHGVVLAMHQAPFVGFWSLYDKEAPFVCIEPWWGIADTLDSTGELENKFGMNHLEPNSSFHASYSISIF